MGRSPQASSATPAIRVLVAAGIGHRVREYEHDPAAPAYGLEAAQALGEPEEKVFKTLVVQTDLATDKGLVMAVVPVARHVDLKAVAKVVGAKKAAMADPSVAQRTTGYVVGGISPVGGKKILATVIDESCLGLSTMLVSGGRRGLDIEIEPADLVRLTGATTAAIAS